MKEVLIQTLSPGKYFSTQTYLDSKYILLSPEVPINEELINRLQRWDFTYVYTEGEIVDTPLGSNGDGNNELAVPTLDVDIRENELSGEARDFYKEVSDYTERIFTDFVTKSEIPIRPISDKIKEIIEMVKNKRRYILMFTEMPDDEKNYIVTHSVRTTILAIAIGLSKSIKLPAHKLIDLGMAALLHEIGMIRLPPQLYMAERKLTPQEKKAITAHTVLGFKILKELNFPMSVCLAVLESHESIDGSGYPRGLTGDKISLYPKIISVCSSFAALTSSRPYRAAIDGHSSILDLLKQRGKQYDETVLRALILNLSIFPIGTYVELTNGSQGIVIAPNDENPRTPTVKLIIGPNHSVLRERPFVQTDEDEYHIVKPLTKQEVEKLKKTITE